MKSNKGLVAIVIVMAMIVGLIVWLKPSKDSTQSKAVAEKEIHHEIDQLTTTSPSKPSILKTNDKVPELADSLSGTQIDCALTADQSGKFIVDKNTKGCFEYFLSQFGELTLTQIDSQVRAYLSQSLPEQAASQSIDLWQRFLKYREAEGNMKGPQPDINDPDQLEKVLSTLAALRKQYFNPLEMDALFGGDMVYDQYTVDRVKILTNKNLDSKAKAKMLNERFSQLPQDLQKNLQDMSKLENLRALTKEIKSKNGSAAELRQMREQLVGAEAANNLEQLDQSRASWKSKVNTYLNQRATILNSNLADVDKQKSIDTLRQQSFTNDAERNRAISFEHFKDQKIDVDKVIN